MEHFNILLDDLSEFENFSRRDLQELMEKNDFYTTVSTVNHMIDRLLDQENIIRTGRNHYRVSDARKLYKYTHSAAAVSMAGKIKNNHPYLDFRIFELVQLNEFARHQLAHNIIFVSVERGLEEDVFNTLWPGHQGSILLKPDTDQLFRYMTEETVVINKLPSESPRGITEFWDTRLEKILVDIAADKLLKNIVYCGEYEYIYGEAVKKYVLDKNTMIRYAKRRGALEKLRLLLNEHTKLAAEEFNI